MNDLTVTALLSLAGPLLGVVATYLTIKKNVKGDAAQQGERDGRLFTKLEHIESSVNELKAGHSKTDAQMMDVVRAGAVTDNKADSAHDRIDRMEPRIIALEGKVH